MPPSSSFCVFPNEGSLGLHCPVGRSAVMEMFWICVSDTVASRHMALLNTGNEANVTKELSFYLLLININFKLGSHMWPVVTKPYLLVSVQLSSP